MIWKGELFSAGGGLGILDDLNIQNVVEQRQAKIENCHLLPSEHQIQGELNLVYRTVGKKIQLHPGCGSQRTNINKCKVP